MPKVNYGDILSRVEQEGLINSGSTEYFKPKEGDNKIRILSESEPYVGLYQGKRQSVKFVTWVFDIAEKKIKLWFMPYVVFKQLADFQKEEGFEFDEVPMPYSVNVKTTNAGKLDVEYNVMPSPKRVPLEQDVLDEFAKQSPITEVVQALKDKRGPLPDGEEEPGAEVPTIDADSEIKAEDIPF